ncbi:MAG: serine/threonine protein kinase, partial [Planctomycetota bacterium]
HEHDVIHRDLKPGNIKITPEGKVKVLDFGLAKVVGGETTDQQTTITEPGRVIGTPVYMSPEQARGEELDARSDLFSFGVVLYEMVTGTLPFVGKTSVAIFDSILHKVPTPPVHLNPELPLELERIINKALEKDREIRYQSAADLRADLKRLKRDTDSDRSATQSAMAPAPPSSSRHRLARRVAWLAVAVPLAILIGATVWFYLHPKPRPALRTVPFTSLSGREVRPAFSPDGDQIAFAWQNEESDNWDIFVQQVGTGARLQLTEHSGDDLSPTWSPNGQEIAFIRWDEGFIPWSEGQRRILKVDALGRAEQHLHTPTYAVASTAGGEFDWSDGGLDWSADGRFLAFSERSAPGQPASIVLLSVETRKTRQLTSPAPPSWGDRDPAFSPDGQTLAFIRGTNDNVDDIFIVPVAGGQPRCLTFDKLRVQGLDWMADGREIVFSSNRGGGFSLWRIAASGGQPEPLAGIAETALDPTIPAQGNRLAYTQYNPDTNIWRLELPKPPGQAKAPTKFISSTRLDMCPEYSPDGQSIAFSSRRSGSPEIWRCDSDGSHPFRLTSFGGPVGGAPRWSPDGRQIAFDSRPEGHTDIFVVSPEGGPPQRLTTQSSDDWVPSWSWDGRWIYFTSNRSGDCQIWKMPAEGGEAVQVTKQGGFFALESPDGQFVYYAKGLGANPELWRVPVDGGEEAPVHDLVKPADWGQWAVVDGGIYYISATEPSSPVIEFFDFATSQVRSIATLEKPTIVGLAVSPDSRWILYTQGDRRENDIMLVENFR